MEEYQPAGTNNARSPWASSGGVVQRELTLHPPIHPPTGAVIRVPGSKSLTNRAIIMAALAEGKSTLRNMLRSDDSYWCLDALRRLGVQFTPDEEEPTTVTIEGAGGQWLNKSGSLYMGAAGTIARFLPGALAAAEQGEWVLEGNERLSERPIAPLVEALNALGSQIHYVNADGQLPLRIQARGLKGGMTTISGAVSSQFLSGLLLASPYAGGTIELRVSDGEIVQHAYVQLTIELMKQFGVEVESSASFDHFVVRPQRYVAQDILLESDVSTCCHFWAYAALTGGRVKLSGIHLHTHQPDIGMLALLERMGCKVTYNEDGEGIELMGPALTELRGGFTVSMKEMSDQTLTLAVLAVFADAPITITDVEHIRAHECDRIQAICESLNLLGIRVEERKDGMKIFPGTPQPPLSAMNTYDDHRMAMSLALIGARVGGIRLRDPGCVSKTCPDYFEQLRSLGMRVQ